MPARRMWNRARFCAPSGILRARVIGVEQLDVSFYGGYEEGAGLDHQQPFSRPMRSLYI